jgi:hypothetical protein
MLSHPTPKLTYNKIENQQSFTHESYRIQSRTQLLLYIDPNKTLGDCVMIGNISPYYVLMNSAPNYAHLKDFGCLSYVATISSKRGKLSPKNFPLCFPWIPFRG